MPFVPERAVVTPIHRLARGARETDLDLVAAEAPLTVHVQSSVATAPRSLGVVMRTPGDDRDLVVGLLYTEGVIQTREDIVDVTVRASDEQGDVAEVRVVDRI